MTSVEPLELKPSSQPVPSATDHIRAWLTWEKIEWFDLQWAHRVGTVALFALIAGLAGAIRDEGPYGLALAAAVVIADIGLVGGILAWWTSRRLAQRTREPTGVILFNLIILILAVAGYTAGHFGYLNPALQWLTSRIPAAS
jgi:hypothetical protein